LKIQINLSATMVEISKVPAPSEGREGGNDTKSQKVRTLKEAGHNVDLTNPRGEWKFDIPSPYAFFSFLVSNLFLQRDL